jgi:hypothetical protein
VIVIVIVIVMIIVTMLMLMVLLLVIRVVTTVTFLPSVSVGVFINLYIITLKVIYINYIGFSIGKAPLLIIYLRLYRINYSCTIIRIIGVLVVVLCTTIVVIDIRTRFNIHSTTMSLVTTTTTPPAVTMLVSASPSATSIAHTLLRRGASGRCGGRDGNRS